jgi:hypothetical protein
MALPSTLNDREYQAFVELGASGVPARRTVLYDTAGNALLFGITPADAVANGSITAIGVEGYNGSTWDRLVAAGDNADAVAAATKGLLAVLGRQYVWNGATWERVRTPNVFKTIAGVAITAGTPQTIWTPAAGKKFRLLGYVLGASATTGAAGSVFILKDNTTEILRAVDNGAGGINAISPPLGNGYLSAAADNPLKLDAAANCTAQGFVCGCEE